MSSAGDRLPDPSARMMLQALAAGKPPAGARDKRFFFGRKEELSLLERDLASVEAGGGAIRFVVGDHKAGKTALLQELLHRARNRRFVTMHADITLDCLLWGSHGEGRALLEQALLNMRTLGSGERSALDAIVGAFGDSCESAAIETRSQRSGVFSQVLAPLAELARGHDFIRILGAHAEALSAGDDVATAKSRRWLLAQYRGDAEARREAGASAISDCDQWTMIKSWSRFARLSGRPGLVLALDEVRMLADISPAARKANFARLSHIFNEILSGQASGLALFIATTPAIFRGDFDSLCSEAGLGSCLHGGRTVGRASNAIDPLAFQIADLEYGDIEAMLIAVRDLIAGASPTARLIPASEISRFVAESRDELGGQAYPLPRELLRKFLAVHDRLVANPSLQWSDVLQGDVRSGKSFAATAAAAGEFVEHVM